jgi:hypothetical protein
MHTVSPEQHQHSMLIRLDILAGAMPMGMAGPVSARPFATCSGPRTVLGCHLPLVGKGAFLTSISDKALGRIARRDPSRLCHLRP